MKIYKYFSSIPRNTEIVAEDKIWLSRPDCFNDVFECECYYDLEDVCLDIQNKHPEMERKRDPASEDELSKEIDESLNEAKKQINEEIRIACFSYSKNSLLMWAHYADSHKGFCVEYNPQKATRVNRAYLFKDVIYQTELTRIRDFEQEALRNTILKSFFIKSKEWSYEQEVRLLCSKRDVSADWNEDVGKIKFCAPDAIYLGCRATEELKNNLKIICENNKIKLYQMHKQKRCYGLKAEEIV